MRNGRPPAMRNGQTSAAPLPTNGSAWTAGGACARRVVRGGSWNYFPENLRAAFRIWYSTVNRNLNLIFRVARTLTP
jgi:formylglycine-generating enzyme required for sulfatase activity